MDGAQPAGVAASAGPEQPNHLKRNAAGPFRKLRAHDAFAGMTALPQAAGDEGGAHPVVALPANLRAGSWHTPIVSSANLMVVALPADARASSPDAGGLVAPDAFRQHVAGVLGEYAGAAMHSATAAAALSATHRRARP